MKATDIGVDPHVLLSFLRRWKLTEIGVFGSAVRGELRPDSDVDFLVSYAPGAEWDLFDLMDMADELGGIVGRRADVLAREAVERCDNRRLRREILSSLEPLDAA